MAEQLSLFNDKQLESLEEIRNAEWCFQFFDNEPVVFAFSKENDKASNLVIELKPTQNDVLTFQQNGMVFKIFPREMSEDSKELREQQKQQEQNESEN